jgi:hypothetical protein
MYMYPAIQRKLRVPNKRPSQALTAPGPTVQASGHLVLGTARSGKGGGRCALMFNIREEDTKCMSRLLMPKNRYLDPHGLVNVAFDQHSTLVQVRRYVHDL